MEGQLSYYELLLPFMGIVGATKNLSKFEVS
jgi:hypothetical protein